MPKQVRVDTVLELIKSQKGSTMATDVETNNLRERRQELKDRNDHLALQIAELYTEIAANRKELVEIKIALK